MRHFDEVIQTFALKAATVFIAGSEAIPQVAKRDAKDWAIARDRCRVLYEFGQAILAATRTRVI